MVSQATWEQIGGALPGRELGRLTVVGRATPVRVFQPLDPGDPAPPPDLGPGLALLKARRWAEALAFFAALEAHDSAAQVYAARCRELLASPAPDWDGVWNLASK
jgi:adenylate cyclase